MAKTEPEGRSAIFSIQVPIGNSWMTLMGRFDGTVLLGVTLASARSGRRIVRSSMLRVLRYIHVVDFDTYINGLQPPFILLRRLPFYNYITVYALKVAHCTGIGSERICFIRIVAWLSQAL